MTIVLDTIGIESEATTMNAGEITAYLQSTLGQQMVAYLSGLKDPKVVGHWIRRDNRPRDTMQMRLRHAYQAARMLTDSYGAETAKAWFFGTNTRLDDEAPAVVLRYAKTPEDLRFVVPAARAFARSAS